MSFPTYTLVPGRTPPLARLTHSWMYSFEGDKRAKVLVEFGFKDELDQEISISGQVTMLHCVHEERVNVRLRICEDSREGFNGKVIFVDFNPKTRSGVLTLEWDYSP